MASLALVTSDTTHTAATNTETALTNQGHTVTLFDEENLGTTDFSPYDAIVTVRTTGSRTATNASELRTEIDNGKPVIVTLVDTFFPGTGAVATATELDLTGTVEIRDDITDIEITDSTHPITDAFGTGALAVYSSDNFWGAVEESSFVGTELADGQSGSDIAGQEVLIAVEQGTTDLAGNTVNARVVVYGGLSGNLSDYSADGEAVLGAIVEWLLTQTITLGTAVNTSTIFGPTLEPGAVTIQLGHVANTSTIHGATLVPGQASIAPGHIPSTAQVFALASILEISSPGAVAGIRSLDERLAVRSLDEPIFIRRGGD